MIRKEMHARKAHFVCGVVRDKGYVLQPYFYPHDSGINDTAYMDGSDMVAKLLKTGRTCSSNGPKFLKTMLPLMRVVLTLLMCIFLIYYPTVMWLIKETNPQPDNTNDSLEVTTVDIMATMKEYYRRRIKTTLEARDGFTE